MIVGGVTAVLSGLVAAASAQTSSSAALGWSAKTTFGTAPVQSTALGS